MPGITIRPSGKHAAPLKETKFLTRTSKDLLHNIGRMKERGDMLNSSFEGDRLEATSGCDNGLAWALIHACTHHHHLKIRPDDVWLAILTQFSAYVHARPEAFRGQFLPHDNKKEELKTKLASDWSAIGATMKLLMQENVTEARLREWTLPNFSTTTENDAVVASIVMMGKMQKYSKLPSSPVCGK